MSNLIPWETENKVEMFRFKVTGPNVELYFSCIPVSTDSLNVLEFKNKIHFVTDFIAVYTESVDLHVPGNIPFTFTEFYIVSSALTNVPFGI